MIQYALLLQPHQSLSSYTCASLDNYMTTNHRPTLESKRGRENAIKDTIQHSRSLNGQTSLKLRLDIKGTNFDPSVGKRALDELEVEHKRVKTEKTEISKEEEVKHEKVEKKEAQGIEEVEGNEANGLDSDNRNAEENNEQSEGEQDEEEEESDESEEDDEGALMAELAKIRKEKEKQKLALAGNPLMSPDGTETTSKRSWRRNAPFAKKATTQPKPFTTNTLESDTHRKFLSKYFR